VGHGAINGKGLIQGPCRRCLSASRRRREIYSRTPYPSPKPTKEANETDKKPLLEKIRDAHFLQEIDKAEDAIRELVALEGVTAQEHRS
jgi:hypothetical protein